MGRDQRYDERLFVEYAVGERDSGQFSRALKFGTNGRDYQWKRRNRSVRSIYGGAGSLCVLIALLINSYGVLIGLSVTLFLCAVIGVCIGVINLYLKVPPMITTLAVGFIVYSAVLIISTMTTGMPSKAVAYFTQSLRIFGISPMILIAAAIAVAMGVLMYKTKFGKRLHAVGQNRTAAALAGINVERTVITAFVISSVLSGVTGTLLGGYFGGASQDMGVAYLITSVAATVIGGTSAAGGKSSVAGAVSGALMVTLLVAFLNLTMLPAAFQRIIQGVLLMVILVASVPKGRRIAAA